MKENPIRENKIRRYYRPVLLTGLLQLVLLGLPASAMTADQQNMLMTLMGYYGNLLNKEDAALRTADLKSHLAQTYFAWYGPTTDTGYFRITGPTAVIEYAPQGAGRGGSGTASNAHIHGIYRDPTNDYSTTIATQ